jgi:anti-sigma factor RsiW
MTELRGPSSTSQTWGGHLALDAIVAFVDDELSSGARVRALRHLAGCTECGTEVVAQTQARVALRRSTAPALPSSLMSSLRAIPVETALPGPPAGLAVGPDGQLVAMLREPRGSHGARRPGERRARLGTGAVVTGLALGGLVVAGTVVGSTGATDGALTGLAGGSTASIGVAPVGRPSVISRVTPAGTSARPVLDARLVPTSTVRSIPVVPSPPTVHHHHS